MQHPRGNDHAAGIEMGVAEDDTGGSAGAGVGRVSVGA